MRDGLRNALRTVYLEARAPFWHRIARSQNGNEEAETIARVASLADVTRSFVEFGFHPFELNSANIIKDGWSGLLLDGNEGNCRIAQKIMRRNKYPVTAMCHWIKKGGLSPIIDFARRHDNKIGVLSVDIDGNDFWITQELLDHFKPEIIVPEYNSSFGLRPITVAYADDFVRLAYSQTGWYHGASITAFSNFLAKDYALIASISGANAVFLRRDKMSPAFTEIESSAAFSENALRNAWAGNTAADQYEAIKDLPFVEIERT